MSETTRDTPTPLDAAARDELARKAEAARDTMAYAACRVLDGEMDHEANAIASRAQGEFLHAVSSPDVILALLAAAGRGAADTKTVSIPRWVFDHAGERFLVALKPNGAVEVDGGHSEPEGVAKARELFQRLVVIRPPEGARYVMVTVEEVPPFTGRLNEEAVAWNNFAARSATPTDKEMQP